MGCIYKIVNSKNGKIYIGMTTRTLAERISEHKRKFTDKNSRMYNFKLYKAMRKYGFESFVFETIVECDNENLEILEKQYIHQYDSISNGYNEAIGGSGKTLISDKQIEAFKILYESGWLLRDIADVFHVGSKSVGKKLKEVYGINTRENANLSFMKNT